MGVSLKTRRCKVDTAPRHRIDLIWTHFQAENEIISRLVHWWRRRCCDVFVANWGDKSVTTDLADGNDVTLWFAVGEETGWIQGFEKKKSRGWRWRSSPILHLKTCSYSWCGSNYSLKNPTEWSVVAPVHILVKYAMRCKKTSMLQKFHNDICFYVSLRLKIVALVHNKNTGWVTLTIHILLSRKFKSKMWHLDFIWILQIVFKGYKYLMWLYETFECPMFKHVH